MNKKFLPNEFFKALSDPTRLSIVQMLSQQGAMCVCNITEQLTQPQPTVSRHLNQLKAIGLLTSERRGTWIWYGINQDLDQAYQQIIELIANQG